MWVWRSCVRAETEEPALQTGDMEDERYELLSDRKSLIKDTVQLYDGKCRINVEAFQEFKV